MDLWEALESAGFSGMIPGYEGRANQQKWTAEDGWVIAYTTSRIEGGPRDGKFATMAFKPVGKGARGGRKTAQSRVRVSITEAATRKTARKRAQKLYAKHSPKWAKHNAWWLSSL